jgi:hypothetical protein
MGFLEIFVGNVFFSAVASIYVGYLSRMFPSSFTAALQAPPFYPPQAAAGFDGFLASVRGLLPRCYWPVDCRPSCPAGKGLYYHPFPSLPATYTVYWYDLSVLFRCCIFTLLSQNIGIFWAIVSGCCGGFGGGPT